MDERATDTPPATGLLLDTKNNDNQEIEGALALFQESTDSTRTKIEIDCLEAAISSLQCALEDGASTGKRRQAISRQLIRALLIRYGIYGWIEDLDRCWTHLMSAESPQEVTELIKEDNDKDIIEVQIAAQLIDAFRRSIDITTVDTIVCVLTHALSSYPCRQSSSWFASLWIILGKALIARYISNGEVEGLDQATKEFQQAELACSEDTSLVYIRLTSLSHIKLLRYIVCGEVRGLLQAFEFWDKAFAVDADGGRLSDMGTEKVQKAEDAIELQNSIALLTASLNRRLAPHPRQSDSLTKLANARFTCFDRLGDSAELDEAISLSRKVLDIKPPPHPTRSAALSNLAVVLSTRFERKGEQEDLEELISLHQEALCLHPAPHPSRSRWLGGLAKALLARFDHHSGSADLEKCITLCRESLDLQHLPNSERARALNNLAVALSRRFEHSGTHRDLNECITLYREALYPRSPCDSERFLLIMNLTTSLSNRLEHEESSEDLDEFIRLRREALDLPLPPQMDHSWLLISLADAVSRRFDQHGTSNDLDECVAVYQKALDIQSPSHPTRLETLNGLARVLLLRSSREGAFEDLRDCINLGREALAMLPQPHPLRSKLLNNLATSILYRFEHEGEDKDLGECIALHHQALTLLDSSDSDRSDTLHQLGYAFWLSFSQKGSLKDLRECIAHHQKALDLRRLPHPKRYLSLMSLATALHSCFEHEGGFENVEKCIILLRESLALLPIPPAPPADRFESLVNLVNALLTRFKHKGAFQDLQECILLCREARFLQPLSQIDCLPLLNGLASALLARFEWKGAFQDLEESIALLREVLHRMSPSHPDRSGVLGNLSNAIFTRFRHKYALVDIEECVNLYQEALDICPPSHAACLKSRSNLAAALNRRFMHTGNFKDIDRSIALCREALDSPLPSHPYRSGMMDILAAALRARFEHGGVLEDIEECIKLHRNALELRPPPDPDRSSSLNYLARALSSRFEHEGAVDDIQAALEYYKEAVQYSPGSLVNRLSASRNWATCAQKHSPTSILDAFSCSMELLTQLVSLDLTLQQRQDVLQHSRDFVGDAAKSAIDTGRYEVAVKFLSTGRSIFWSQALQLRTAVDELMITHSSIAKKFVTISRQLENASYSEPISISRLPIDKQWDEDSSGCKSLHKLVNQRQETVKEIQKIPGYENFLLPAKFSYLQSGAKDGPVILLNASRLGSDVLIMHETGPLKHIPLAGILLNELRAVKLLLDKLSRAGIRSIKISPDAMDALKRFLKRDMGRLNSSVIPSEEIMRVALEYLWVTVVKPVITALGAEKTHLPGRIWWCPTGLFASLPIHAAGIYAGNNQPVDCLFEYVVSSYCTSPQDLLHPEPQIAKSFRMTAVIEPEAPDAATLPATRTELSRIRKHVHDQHLITHEGSRDQPNQVGDLISDIQRSSIVHFGCHGMQNLEDPLESCLLLSGGKLTMSKIIKECRVPEGALAYLSACETAKGDEVRPNESLNLVATMMFAGFRGVVGTLWSIMDDDAPIVADVFYRHLFRNGKETAPDMRDAAYGLHLATQELRDRGKPFFNWVPYVHYGI